MADCIETINGSTIQHGDHNDRIYLMRLNRNDIAGTLARLADLAVEKGYGKSFARIPLDVWPEFKNAGYRKEAVIPDLYRGCVDGLFVARYFSAEREVLPHAVVKALRLTKGDRPTRMKPTATPPCPQPVVACNPCDCPEMSRAYEQVFESYPFPIHDPGYLERMMGQDVFYYAVRANGAIAALAAAEADRDNQSVEMTDFATLPAWRQYGMAATLLRHMEKEARMLGIKTAYTIARADSPGINRLFQGNGYRYAGLLINNTQISGRIQSMSVRYKPL